MKEFVILLLIILLVKHNVTCTTIDFKERNKAGITLLDNISMRSAILAAIKKVESGGHPNELNKLQIMPIMVKEVNNIIGHKKYSLSDRYDENKSIQMFMIYTDHHTPSWDLELVARRWNGGYNGEVKEKTFMYYLKVKEEINSLIKL